MIHAHCARTVPIPQTRTFGSLSGAIAALWSALLISCSQVSLATNDREQHVLTDTSIRLAETNSDTHDIPARGASEHE